ncbi:MAG: BatA domain-containing protein, partial [Pseudomonadota bacterium]
MWAVGPLGFAAPWLLLGLVALPILWILLRAVPPAPIRRRFPGVALLLGLSDDETQTDKTPWWLLLLRMLAVAAAIIAFAGPVLNPEQEDAGEAPILVLLDGGWAEAPTWSARMERVEALLADAARDGRPVAIAQLTSPDAGPITFQSAESWGPRLAGFEPQAWMPSVVMHESFAARLDGAGDFDTFWMADGQSRAGREELLAALEARGEVRAFESPRPVYALEPVRFEDGEVRITGHRLSGAGEAQVTLQAFGRDPAGTERILATANLDFEAGAAQAGTALTLPPELRNRITRLAVAGARSAGAVSLTDDGLRRREVALLAGRQDREGLQLLSPLHYLNQALIPTADIVDGALSDILLANPDVIVMADVAQISEAPDVLEWVEAGGVLLRFAGPRMAAADIGRAAQDPLLPVRLRAGGRSVGGAMSWGEPKTLREFSASSPFFGLEIPEDVSVTAQVLAEPDPALAEATIASLTDGTPLVTRSRVGDGQVILFHVTANAEWSTLPLSGLFVEMLERLAISSRPPVPSAEDLAGTTWQPVQLVSGFGEIEAAGTRAGIAGETLAEAEAGPALPPGLYQGEDRSIALNAVPREAAFTPYIWPARISVEGLDVVRETPLKGFVLMAGLALLMADLIASLWLSGRLTGPRAGGGGAVAGLVLAAVIAQPAEAQDSFALEATGEVVLGYVITGDAALDQTSFEGLRGISRTLFQRTSVEPVDPLPVNIETDELAFFPFLYWPVSATQPTPSPEAYVRLNR